MTAGELCQQRECPSDRAQVGTDKVQATGGQSPAFHGALPTAPARGPILHPAPPMASSREPRCTPSQPLRLAQVAYASALLEAPSLPPPPPRPQGCSGPPSLKGPLPTFAKHCAQHWHGAGNTLVAQPWPHCAGTQGCARPLGRAGPREHCGADGSVLQTKAKVVLRWVGLRDRKISMGGGGVV